MTSSSSSQWFGYWIQEVSIKPAVYLRSGWFLVNILQHLTVYHVVFHTCNMSRHCITGSCSHEHKILLIEACWSSARLENAVFFSAVFLCDNNVYSSIKKSIKPTIFFPPWFVFACIRVWNVMFTFGRQLRNMMRSMKSDWQENTFVHF